MHFIMLGILSLLAFNVHAVQDYDRQQIELRIKPIGQVNIEEEAGALKKSEKPKEEEKKIVAQPGEEIYQKYCNTCHQAGIAGAPRFQNAADWKPRLEKGLEALVASAIKGINAMPPKGTCQECTEEDIKTAIQYMIPKNEK